MHIKRRAPFFRRQTLASKIDITLTDTPLFDVEDNDVLGYIHELIQQSSGTPFLKRLNLATRDDALRALAVIERAQRHVEGDLRTARALRVLINTRSEELDSACQ